MSGLQKINKQLAEAKSVKEALELNFVKDVFIKNYSAITGKKDGENRFMTEKFHYLELINDNEKLRNADKFSHFAAIVKAGTTGLSFAKEGQLYPILYGNIVKVQIGAHGKRELIQRMPNVMLMAEAQVVVKGDTFRYDKLTNKVLEHVTSEKAPVATMETILFSYVRILFKDKSEVFVVVPHEDLMKAKSKSKDTRENNTWNQWPGEMSKKVAYNRAYKLYYRQPQIEVSEFKGFEAEEEETADTSYQEVVDQSSGEVTQEAVPQEQKVEPKPEPKKEKVQEATPSAKAADDFLNN